jgi:hypothetical protein
LSAHDDPPSERAVLRRRLISAQQLGRIARICPKNAAKNPEIAGFFPPEVLRGDLISAQQQTYERSDAPSCFSLSAYPYVSDRLQATKLRRRLPRRAAADAHPCADARRQLAAKRNCVKPSSSAAGECAIAAIVAGVTGGMAVVMVVA